jgi:hypothetical protein
MEVEKKMKFHFLLCWSNITHILHQDQTVSNTETYSLKDQHSVAKLTSLPHIKVHTTHVSN